MIKLARIDYRLLHGQVVFAWSKALNIQRIIIINAEAARDEFKKTTLSLSKPSGARLNIFDVDSALGKMPKVEELDENVMIIFGNTAEALEFIRKYPKIKELNYGVLPKKEGSTQFSQVIYLDENDLKNSRELKELGVELYMQQVPSSKREDLSSKL